MSTSALPPSTSVAFSTFTGRDFLRLAWFVHWVVSRRPFPGVPQAPHPCMKNQVFLPGSEPGSYKVWLTLTCSYTGRWNNQTLFQATHDFRPLLHPSSTTPSPVICHMEAMWQRLVFLHTSSSCSVFCLRWKEGEMKQYLTHGQTMDLDMA